MRFAIPTNYTEGLESPVYEDFSECKYFLIVDADDGSVKKYETMPNELPPEVDAITGVQAFFLAGKSVEAVLADRIAEKDRLALVGNNIRVFLGASGTASDALRQYFEGRLKESSECGSGNVCECG
jgi:predicted Fe-Mo cluster-binding NifX family protein